MKVVFNADDKESKNFIYEGLFFRTWLKNYIAKDKILITAYDRGWSIKIKNGQWVYKDNEKPIDKNRPCKKCERPPTKEGYDACLGYLPGVKYACCGHGVSKPYQKRSVERK